jgi:hypothetical protein
VYYPDDGGSSSLIAGISYLIFGVLYFLIFVAWYVVSSWFTGRVFAKAGIPQWKGWVPFYNIWVFLELGGQPGWVAVLAWIPGANLVTTVFRCIAAYRIGWASESRAPGWCCTSSSRSFGSAWWALTARAGSRGGSPAPAHPTATNRRAVIR